MTKEILHNTDDRMKKAVEVCRQELAKIHAGRASAALLDGIRVDSYGTQLPLNQVASINVPDARTIQVTPWDKSLLGAIDKAILAANVGLNPVSDGTTLRCPVQPPTEDRRKELVRLLKKFGEDAKVAIRNVRRDSIEHLKKSEKAEHIPEDERKHAEVEVQKYTDRHVKEVDDLLAQKEREIMEV